MRERSGDLFVIGRVCSALVITTNGSVKTDGTAVMGRGVAKTAKDKYGNLDIKLGRQIRRNGNVVQIITRRFWLKHPYYLVSFPVKRSWWDDADMKLIKQSCKQLVKIADKEGWSDIAMPRPGCGNGNLKWSPVKKAIKELLDDRFVIVNNEGKSRA